MFSDKTLVCSDCSGDFTFSAGEQEFFASKNLKNVPKRCPNCRLYSRVNRAGKSPEVISKANCHECKVEFLLPFKPQGYKPTYCNTCFRKQREAQAEALERAEEREKADPRSKTEVEAQS